MSDTLTPEVAHAAVTKLALMAFFPGDPDIRAALISVFLEMVETNEQMEWLVNRALRLYARWPGVAEMRALFCSRYKPRDGEEVYSSVYLDGIPSERSVAPSPTRLPPGHDVTANVEFEDQLRNLAKVKRFPGRDRMEMK